jgi:hypothetical protein
MTIMTIAAMAPFSFANAQGPDLFAPPPPQPGPGHSVTVADVPLDTLTAALALSPDQQSQVLAIQTSTQELVRDLMPRQQGAGQAPDQMGPGGTGQGGPQFGQGGPGYGRVDNGQSPSGFGLMSRGAGGGGFSGPPPVDPAISARVKTVEANATIQIDGLLTDSQTKSLGTLMDQLKDLQTDGISPRLFAKLQLTSDQLTEVHTIAAASNDSIKSALETALSTGDYNDIQEALQVSRQKARQQVAAILTSAQKTVLNSERQGREQMGMRPPLGNFGGQFDNQLGPPPGGGQFGGPGGGPGGQGGPGQDGPPQSDAVDNGGN